MSIVFWCVFWLAVILMCAEHLSWVAWSLARLDDCDRALVTYTASGPRWRCPYPTRECAGVEHVLDTMATCAPPPAWWATWHLVSLIAGGAALLFGVTEAVVFGCRRHRQVLSANPVFDPAPPRPRPAFSSNV